jgi:hypothetical protein
MKFSIEEVTEMAKAAGFPYNKYGLLQGDSDGEIEADDMFLSFASTVSELAEAKEREAFTRICLEIAAEQEEIMRAHSGKEDQDDESRFDHAYELASAARILSMLVPGRRVLEKEVAQ